MSHLIEGQTLKEALSNSSMTWHVAVPMLVSIAETLEYVHGLQLIHRDIKPGNLLLDEQGKIYLADFGLAMHETRAGDHQAVEGTLNYMSPEQVSGEGHLIDCRSDLFSLGSVMYEMLTGSRPFQGADYHATVNNLLHQNPPALLECTPGIPAELNRICLRLLCKRAADRYQHVRELLEDLRHFQEEQTGVAARIPGSGTSASRFEPTVEVMPRGLRSFEGQHAYFFLQLLPGPFDRDGLPESLSHWVRWVQRGAERPDVHRIGVIAGPSGCGKSSLVKAGLIPLLKQKSVRAVMIEASQQRTESDLADALDAKFPELMTGKTLSDRISAIRRGKALPTGQNLLIVIDQFEQWLHSQREHDVPDLVRALRQCDGRRVQCLVLVRDDFWMALNRFMEAVEAPLTVGQTVSLVDLFSLPHARDVLTKFGRSFGRLPKDKPPSVEAVQFVEQATEFVAQEGKVFPVHLSLFAEMVKSREWIPQTLHELGGAVGVGLLFLREAFSAEHAPAAQRVHEEAARRALQSLLPDVGTEIKTRAHTRAELMAESGYGDDLNRFNDLMKVLEGDLKLISPIDTFDQVASNEPSKVHEARYQLSHDFLVPSIREWLYSEQRKTIRGRCRVMLEEQAAIWSKQPVRRNLPLWRDWVLYRVLLSPASVKESERRMLRAADRYRGGWTLTVVLVLIALGVGVNSYRNSSLAQVLVDQIVTAEFEEVPNLGQELSQLGHYSQRALLQALKAAEPDSPQELKLRLAQSPMDQDSLRLIQLGLDSEDNEIEAINRIRDAIYPQRERCRKECWQVVEQGVVAAATKRQVEQAFRALLLLAKLDPPSESQAAATRWEARTGFLTQRMLQWITSHPNHFGALVEAVRPISALIIAEFRQPDLLGVAAEFDSARWAALFLNELEQAAEPRALLVLDAAPWQWEYLPPSADQSAMDVYRKWLGEKENGNSSESPALVNRIANAAVLVLAYSTGFSDWDLLKRSSQEDIRSLMIHRMAITGVPLSRLEDRVAIETDPGILSALAMAIGEYPRLADTARPSTKERIRELWQSHPDSEVHAACQWLMTQMGIVREESGVASDMLTRQGHRQWRLTKDGHQMVRLDARHVPGIGRVFEIGAVEVSVKQYLKFRPQAGYNAQYAPTGDCPINLVKWYDALLYANYLSKEHGIPDDQLFIPARFSQIKEDKELKEFLPAAEDLARTGYRLPTSEEWQYACLGESNSKWFYGTRPELMVKYAVVSEGKLLQTDPLMRFSRPGGSVKPNHFGISDMFGNVLEWTTSCHAGYTEKRVLRGGSHTGLSTSMSGIEINDAPMDEMWYTIGFRIARTLPE